MKGHNENYLSGRVLGERGAQAISALGLVLVARRALHGVHYLGTLLCWAALLGAAAGCSVPVSPPEGLRAAPQAPLLAREPVATAALGVIYHSSARTCGAVAVGPRTVLTAAHCVSYDSATQTITALPDGSRAPFYVPRPVWDEHLETDSFVDPVVTTVLRTDTARDLVWLSTDEELSAWLPTRPMVDGEPVWILGSRTGEHLETNGVPGYAETAPVRPGDSGSPVVGSDGAVLGVMSTCDFRGGDECARGGTYGLIGERDAI